MKRSSFLSWFILLNEIKEWFAKFPSHGLSFSMRSTLQSFPLMVRPFQWGVHCKVSLSKGYIAKFPSHVHPFQWGVHCKVSLSKEYIAKFPSHGSSFSLRSTLQSFPFKGVHSKVSLSWLSFHWGVHCKVSLSKEYIAKFPSHGCLFIEEYIAKFPFQRST